MPTECDVVICGLGPVGQLLAHQLGALGVDTVAIDAAPGPYDLPRAAVIDDEVLRILQAVGLDAAIVAESQVQVAASYVTARGRPVRILSSAAGVLGHPPLVSIHQPSMERTMVAALAGRESVRVRWRHVLEAVAQDSGGVTARVRDERGAHEVRARWVVGCDGATSTLRRLLGVGFGGSTFAQRWLVVDARVDRPLGRVPHPYFVGDAERPTVSLPMSPGRHRWEWMLRPGEAAGAFLAPEAIDRRIAPWLDDERAEVERAVLYTYHARTAARWRVGRALLAGDAAHVMPPFAGQGLSSGARDASNLAWKLAAVLGGAPDALLDTYEQERRPHVHAMQELAVRWGAVVQTGRPRAARARDAFMAAFDGSPAQRWVTGHVKPLPTYRAGAFARRPRRIAPVRTVGALFPQPRVRDSDGAVSRLDDLLPAGWLAVAVEPRAAAGLRARGVAVLELGDGFEDLDGTARAWLGRASATWALLRPDRFVFACGTEADVARALAGRRRLLG